MGEIFVKKFLKKMRNKLHTDLVNLLNHILSKLDKNAKEEFEQYRQLQKNIEFVKNDIQNNIDNKTEKMDYNISMLVGKIDTVSKELNEVKEKLYRNDWEPKQNIKQYLQQVAGLQTAEYIIKNMPVVKAFNVTLDILTYGISQVTVDGMYLEFGVFSGKTINHIAEKVQDKIIYGFDSFEGLPEDWRTGFGEGTFKRNNLPEVKNNVCLIKGWFNKTLPDFVKDHDEKCAFIHIDCDLYSSTKCVFDLLKDKIVSGTIICFDEYFNYPDWQNGEYKALQEFVTENNLSYEYIGYVEIMEQVAIRIL